ncbi:MAG TPA: hypothetical protein VMW83_12700 [Spirochaetia bacterium]|nr:hypothetical protein [Spirochaetia bacterium]
MIKRLLATFDPKYNPEVAALASKAWPTWDDRAYHYRRITQVLRHMSESCQFWSKAAGHRGYVNHVVSFLVEHNLMPEGDRIDFTLVSPIPAGFDPTAAKEGT